MSDKHYTQWLEEWCNKVRNDALEEAARMCEELLEGPQRNEYNNVTDACAAAIRALKNTA